VFGERFRLLVAELHATAARANWAEPRRVSRRRTHRTRGRV